jgi:hypothetical protein
MKMEDLKFRVQYNFGGDFIAFLGSLSNFQEEGTVNCAVTRQMFLADPTSMVQNSLNSIVEKLIELYVKNPDSDAEIIESHIVEVAQISDVS